MEQLFLVLSGEPHSVTRRDVLRLALRGIEVQRSAVLLWLWDPDWKCFALSTQYTALDPAAAPPLLRGLFTSTSADPDTDLACVSTARHARLLTWARQHGFDHEELILPVRSAADTTPGHRTIGLLQFLSATPIDTSQLPRLTLLSAGVAALLSRSREVRKLTTVDRLLDEHATRSTSDWLDVAAETLLAITHASVAIMFRETREGYKSLAIKGGCGNIAPLIASDISVVTSVATRRRAVRLRDFADEAARIAAFGRAEHDLELHQVMESQLLREPLRSVLLTPVVFQNHTLAVIALVNKSSEVHLAEAFSKTDEDVLNTVAGFLAGILPSLEMSAAVNKLATAVSLSSQDALDNPVHTELLFDVLAEMIPGTTGAALIRRVRGKATPELQHLGGDLWTADPLLLSQRSPGIHPVPAQHATGRRYYFMAQHISTLGEPWLLVLQLARADLTGYEQQFLTFFCKELSHLVVSRQGREEVVERFAQLRHAIRSGLTGVVGYVHEALSCFELYRDLDYSPSVLSQARFRKALQRANFSASKTQHLLEESRFLLGSITASGLRLGSHSLLGVLKAVLDSVRPYAAERNVELAVNSQLRGSEMATFDKGLIEMLIFNLLDNAIKYSFRDRTVEVHLERVRHSWLLSLTDFGVPILPQDREVIFQPFTRRPSGDAGDKRPGTGLGLAVGREIARAHGGDISCDSILMPDGAALTTFLVSIPYARPEHA